MDWTKPRVAIYYWVLKSTGFRNDGAPLYANYNLRKILNGNSDLKDESGNVLHLFPYKAAENFGKFDLNLWVDHGEDGLDVPLDWIPPSPNAYWVSDTHIDAKGYNYRLEMAKQFDHVFCCQKRAMEDFVRDGVHPDKVHFLPHAVEPDVYKPYSIIEKWDWAFIGHLNSQFRVDIMDRFCKEIPSWYLGWRMPQAPGFNVFDDVAKKFSQARIVVSNSIKDDINMRTFEAMACKRPLLTNSIPHLGDMFEHDKDLVLYSSIDDAIDKARALLADDEKRRFIAENGYNKVLAEHTYKHRMLDILRLTCDYVPDYVPDQEVVNAAH